MALSGVKPGRPSLESATIATAARHTLGFRVPLLGIHLEVQKAVLPFYVGLAATVALDLVDWPLALVVGVGHYVAMNSHNQMIREGAAGVHAGA